MLSFIAALALGASTPATARLEIGKADWDRLPRLQRVERPLPTSALVTQVETILASKQCRLKGQNARRFDITVPYAVMLGSDGKAHRVLVADMGCAPLENMVGDVVYQLSDLGDFRRTQAQSGRWYADQFDFVLQ